MKLRWYFSFLLMLTQPFAVNAQELRMFKIQLYRDTVAFVSLSDAYDLSDIPDSIAVEKGFLFKAKISETDKVFVYDFSTSVLKTFRVKDLKIVNYRDGYEETMTGFRIDKRLLKGLNFNNTLVYVGKENPFVQKRLTQVVWEKTEPSNFPSTIIELKDTRYFKEGKYTTSLTYKFETKNLKYYVQDLLSIERNWHFAKQLIVSDSKTMVKVYENVYYAGESASFAPLDNQWTGRLFKNKPSVIFGFQDISFGCPGIQFISSSEKGIILYCDNNH